MHTWYSRFLGPLLISLVFMSCYGLKLGFNVLTYCIEMDNKEKFVLNLPKPNLYSKCSILKTDYLIN